MARELSENLSYDFIIKAKIIPQASEIYEGFDFSCTMLRLFPQLASLGQIPEVCCPLSHFIVIKLTLPLAPVCCVPTWDSTS